MKVLHVISSMYRGGRERQLATIYKHSKGKDINSKILIFNKTEDNYLKEYNIPKEDIFHLTEKNLWGRLLEIKKIINKYHPAIIYAWGGFEVYFCFFLSPFIKGKIINGSIRHGKVEFNKKHISRLILLHLSKYIIANSKAGLKANKLNRGYVLYNGIDEKFLDTYSDKNKSNIIHSVFNKYKDETIFISVANLVPFKDYFTILRALKQIKEKGFRFFFIAIGEGLMRSEIEAEIKFLDLENEVKFLGRKTNVQEYLNASDVFIHSSKGEGCSNAILEAMASGLPIIASDTGGTKEITGSENGQLFPYKNVEKLIIALEDILSDKNRMIEKSKKSRSIVMEKFTVDAMTDNYISILKKIEK